MKGEALSKRYILGLGLIIALAAIGIIIFVLMKTAAVKEPIAEVYQDGELIRSVPLSENCEFTVTCAEGYNTVTVRDGEVMISSADCPDKVCVRTGAISGGAVPIVCLPHKLEIRVVGADGLDAEI